MRHKYVGLDGLRGVAALAVAVHHIFWVLHAGVELPNGELAVEFFFILSGFVLAHAYGERLDNGGRPEFIRARFVRLLPMLVFGTLLGAAAQLTGGVAIRTVAMFTGLGLLSVPYAQPTPIAMSIMPLDPPAWSLFFELAASSAFAFGLWRGRLANLAVVAGAIAMAAVILVHGSPNVGWEPRTFPLGFVAVTFGFGLGTWLYRCRLSVPRLPIGVLAVMLLAVLLLPALYAPFQAVALFVIFPFIILSGSRDTSQSRLCRVGGELSYPFYLVHWPVYVMVGRLAHGWTAVAVAMPLSLAVAYGATRFYDAPIRTWFSSLARRGREGAPSGSTSATALDVEVLEESATAI